MLLRHLTALLLLAALAAPAWSKAHSSASLRQTMQDLYTQLDKAVDRRDVDRIIAFYDPAYEEIRGNKEVGYQAYAATLTAILGHASKMVAKTTVQNAQAVSDGVVVVSRTHEAGVIKDPRTGKRDAIEQTEVDRDYWVHDTGSWKLRQERILSLAGTINGKPIKLS